VQQIQVSSYRWAILFVAVLGFVLFNYGLQSVPPLLNQFQALFGIDNATAGLLMSLVVIPGIFLALPAGLLINKYGFRKIGFFSATLIALGSVVTALSSTFSFTLVGRALLGIGGCFLTIGAAVVIPQWFHHKEIGKAMGIYVAGVPIAVTLAFFTTPVLAQNYGWQLPFYIGAAASIVSAALFLVTMKDGPYKMKDTDGSGGLKQVFSNREIWKTNIVWMLFNMGAIGFLTWAPVMFVMYKGFNIVDASILSSSVMIVNLFLVPLYGWVSDKLDRRKPFIMIGAVATSVTYFVISYTIGLPLVAAIILSGITAGLVPGLVMATAARSLPPKQAGVGFGVMTMWQNIGITITAPLVGYILQASGSMLITFSSLAIFSLVIAAITLTAHSR
jgi:MFS family permease